MPRCYLLALSVGSSLDQSTNNVSLFNLVEQINVPPGLTPPPDARVPLEVHAYFTLDGSELGQELEVRFVLVGLGGLETFAEPLRHRVATPRFRARMLGLPVPPGFGHYALQVEVRVGERGSWSRDPLSYPFSFVQLERTPPVTH
jgi:hypothetical protein